MTGPSRQEQWMYWQYKTPEQVKRGAAMKELEKLITAEVVCTSFSITSSFRLEYIGELFLNDSVFVFSLQKRKPHLAYDELTTVRKNLETQNVDVDNEFVSGRHQLVRVTIWSSVSMADNIQSV